MIRSLTTSPDAQWAAVRVGREVSLFAGGASPATAKIELDGDDVDLALIGPPTALIAVSRGSGNNKVVLYQPPYLDAVARLDLEIPAKLVAAAGPRIVVVSPDAMHAMVVRSAGRALATQKLEVAGPIEFVVGLERNQLLFGLHKKLEVWDAVSGRPLLRPQFQLPPSPRTLGSAHGHMWAMRNGSEEIFIYRLSDGRPFRHHAASPIREVISHPASSLLVLVTERGIIRLNCFSHTMQSLDALPGTPVALAQLGIGDDVTLLGLSADGDEPWGTVLSGNGAPTPSTLQGDSLPSAPLPTPIAATVASSRLGAETSAPVAIVADAPLTSEAPPRAGGKAWREQLAAVGTELSRAGERSEPVELPIVAIDNELGDLAHRLALSSPARRALIALYALHLVGVPSLSIAKLAQLAGSWPEALGQGDLGQLCMLRSKPGSVRLRRSVASFLDGAAPRWIRIVGSGPTTPRAGLWRIARDGRTNSAIETALAEMLGRIAIVEGPVATAVLEARLHGATALATTMPSERPRPWPRDAGLVLVLPAAVSSWVADVPTLE